MPQWEKCVDSKIACAAREGHGEGIALWPVSQDLFASDRYCPSPLLWDRNTAFGRAEDNQQLQWHFASINMLLLGIYPDLQLTHLESELSQFMSLCGLRFVSLLCLAFTIACQASWTSLWVPVSTPADLPAVSFGSDHLWSLSNHCNSAESTLTHLHGTTLPWKAVVLVLPFGSGHRAGSWGNLLNLLYFCGNRYGSCYSHIFTMLVVPLLSAALPLTNSFHLTVPSAWVLLICFLSSQKSGLCGSAAVF